MPKTLLGKWSVGLAVAMPALFVLGGSLASTLYAGVTAGNSIGEDLSSRPALALSMLTAILAGIVGAVLGVIAIRRLHERAALVYCAVGVGTLLLLFLTGELLLAE